MGLARSGPKSVRALHTHENDDRVELVVDTEFYKIEESARINYAGKRQVDKQTSESDRHASGFKIQIARYKGGSRTISTGVEHT